MSYNTYSFKDVSVVITHPAFGQIIVTGQGIGSITTEMTTERTVHGVAADGTIMVSKIPGRNGTISIVIQQTSTVNQQLQKLYNYLEGTSTDQWAGITVAIRDLSMKQLETCTGVSFGKQPSNPKQAQGQNLTWPLMAADIQRDVA